MTEWERRYVNERGRVGISTCGLIGRLSSRYSLPWWFWTWLLRWQMWWLVVLYNVEYERKYGREVVCVYMSIWGYRVWYDGAVCAVNSCGQRTKGLKRRKWWREKVTTAMVQQHLLYGSISSSSSSSRRSTCVLGCLDGWLVGMDGRTVGCLEGCSEGCPDGIR